MKKTALLLVAVVMVAACAEEMVQEDLGTPAVFRTEAQPTAFGDSVYSFAFDTASVTGLVVTAEGTPSTVDAQMAAEAAYADMCGGEGVTMRAVSGPNVAGASSSWVMNGFC